MLKRINPKLKITDDLLYMSLVDDIINNPAVIDMKNYIHHGKINCFEHSLHVSYLSYRLSKKLKLDYTSSSRGGFLHDFYLYDWHIKNERKGLHGFTHSKESLKNAEKIFNLSDKEKDIILKHMWPLNIKFPAYKESFLVCFVDKYCAIKEYF
ncbi:HD domain-containing protein [Helicovermis profundi]|uniref:HD domain-containing protein n=1 Tax=Helicovermis profundi TaxID=3065157 RepID=A0AAU9EFM1_9FIRM|nr:HD domain-containing protein [Clostridia bacterium S502]